MGTYINKGNDGFLSAIESEYVDKTGMIAVINKTLGTEQRYTCVTRCRRFGKTMAAKMLCAYYDKSCDSRSLFEGLNISQPDKEVNGKMEDKQFEKHLNKYPVICLDITNFTTKYGKDKDIVCHIQEEIISELLTVYPTINRNERDDLMDILVKIVEHTDEKFIFIIDEWDAVCREYDKMPDVIDRYVDLLRRLFKGGSSEFVFAGVYMTGILPIKKYKTQSALNNFEEYSMIDPADLATYFGFTPKEVEVLAKAHGADMEELEKWYDGYRIGDEKSIYNPYSVMKAIKRGKYKSYWSATGAFESVSDYISRNYEGLKDDIIGMLAGERCEVDTTTFENDPAIVRSKDDIFTILIHLGYLSYDWDTEECNIPNKEVAKEMENAVKLCNWDNLNKALESSKRLLRSTLEMDEEAVAKGIELTHDEDTSILSYNDENSLACVLSIAYYYAKNNYIIHRELASGKGFADLVLIPRRNVDSPALVLELKYNKDANAAIDQIKNKNYPAKVMDYTGKILLVGINYDKKGPEGKKHTCKIEKITK